MRSHGIFMHGIACQPYANQKLAVSDWRKPNHSRVTLTITRLPASLSSRARASVRQAECSSRVMHGCAGSVHVTQHILGHLEVSNLVPQLKGTVVSLALLLPFCLIAT